MANIKKLHSRAEWEIELVAVTPIHIGGSQEKIKNQHNKEASAASASLMDIKDPSEATSFLLPGSSFRGITRQYLENVGTNFQYKLLSYIVDELYGKIGRDSLKGRIWFSDVYIPKQHSIIKNMTPIDRLTNKPLAPLTLHSVKPGTSFKLTLTIENATIYEYGVIGILLRAFDEQLIAIGSGQSRGLGRLQLQSCTTTIYQYGRPCLTEDDVEIPISNFEKARTLLATTYKNKATGSASYEWLQFATTALGECLKKGAMR